MSSLDTSFFFKKTFIKRNENSPLLNHIKGNTSRFGSAIQVLPSDIRKYFSSFLITAVAVVFISMFISVIENCIFFINVNSYVGNKVDLTCMPWIYFVVFFQYLMVILGFSSIHLSVTTNLVKVLQSRAIH